MPNPIPPLSLPAVNLALGRINYE